MVEITCFINITPTWRLGGFVSREASIDYAALQIITCLPGVMSFHALPHLVAMVAKLFYVRK